MNDAAMEFLLTYGWAILVVLIAIGTLAYFGALSPEKFKLPDKNIGCQSECNADKCHIFQNDTFITLRCCYKSKWSNITHDCLRTYQVAKITGIRYETQ